jgi:hypothetical protein
MFSVPGPARTQTREGMLGYRRGGCHLPRLIVMGLMSLDFFLQDQSGDWEWLLFRSLGT